MNTKTRKTEPTDAADLTTARIRVLKDERPKAEAQQAEAAALVDSLEYEYSHAFPLVGKRAYPVYDGRPTLPVEIGDAQARLDLLTGRLADIDRELAHLEAVADADNKEREAQHALDTYRADVARIKAECEVQTQRRADLVQDVQTQEAELTAARDAEADLLVAGKASDPETVDRIARRLDTTRRAIARLDDSLAGAQRDLEVLQARCDAVQAEIDLQRMRIAGQAFDAAMAALVPVAASYKRARAKVYGWGSATTLPSLEDAAAAHIRAAAEAEG